MSPKITVVTWPISGPIYWMHWPLHHALATVCARLGIEVEYSEKRNDNQIQAAFLRSAGKLDKPVLALGQPPARNNVPPGLDFRLIPLLWRLPHWKCRPTSFHRAATTKAIACFPEGTTSGDYVRTLLGPGVDHAKLEFASDGSPKKNLKKTVYSPMPLHKLFPKTWRVMREYAGPTMDVTALMVPTRLPDAPDARTSDPCAELLDRTLGELRGLLHSMYELHGTASEVQKALQRLDSDSSLRGRRQELTGEVAVRAAEVMASYLHRGAYFPYHVLPTALARETRRHIVEALERHVPMIRDYAEARLTAFIGGVDSWDKLPLGERTKFLRSRPAGISGTVQNHLAHQTERPLSQFAVATGPHNSTLPLLSLRPTGRVVRCESTSKSCLATVIRPACFTCHVVGRVKCLADEEVLFLQENIGSSAVTVVNKCPADSSVCFLCWKDLRRVTQLFADEAERHEPKEIEVSLGVLDTQADQIERVVYVIACKRTRKLTKRESNGSRATTAWASSPDPGTPQFTGLRFYARDSGANWKLFRGPGEFERNVLSFLPQHPTVDFAYVALWEDNLMEYQG